jgi:hypothetical protein
MQKEGRRWTLRPPQQTATNFNNKMSRNSFRGREFVVEILKKEWLADDAVE